MRLAESAVPGQRTGRSALQRLIAAAAATKSQCQEPQKTVQASISKPRQSVARAILHHGHYESITTGSYQQVALPHKLRGCCCFIALFRFLATLPVPITALAMVKMIWLRFSRCVWCLGLTLPQAEASNAPPLYDVGACNNLMKRLNNTTYL